MLKIRKNVEYPHTTSSYLLTRDVEKNKLAECRVCSVTVYSSVVNYSYLVLDVA